MLNLIFIYLLFFVTSCTHITWLIDWVIILHHISIKAYIYSNLKNNLI